VGSASSSSSSSVSGRRAGVGGSIAPVVRAGAAGTHRKAAAVTDGLLRL
jgi:hypothetical protein